MCNKKKLDEISAMLIIANSQKRTQSNFKRKEIRKYYCIYCKAWHTTSQIRKS